MKYLFILFLLVPVVEIYFLINIGSAIGAGTTIILILLTAFIGAILVRAQGFSTFVRVQRQLARGEVPAIEILEGLFLLVAGALLLTPGFLTDAIGFVFLTPPLRKWIIRRIIAGGNLHGAVIGRQNGEEKNVQGRIIDGEFHDPDR